MNGFGPYGCPPVVTEKQKAYQESESFKAEAIKYYSKEPDNIHQLMYEKATRVVRPPFNLIPLVDLKTFKVVQRIFMSDDWRYNEGETKT